MSNIENLFRFISLRPTTLPKQRARLIMEIYKNNGETPLYAEISKALKAGASTEDLAGIAVQYKASARYVASFASVKFPVAAMLDWIAENGRRTFKEADFVASMEKIAGKKLKEMLKDGDFLSAYHDLCDSVLADILSGAPVDEREEKITAIKVLYTLKAVGTGKVSLLDGELLDEFFGRSTVVFPLLKTASKRAEEERQPSQPPVDERAKERQKKKELLVSLETAHRELSTMATDEQFRYLPPRDGAIDARVKDLEEQVQRLSSKCKEIERPAAKVGGTATGALVHTAQQEFILSEKAHGMLSVSTKQLLEGYHFEANRINPVKAVGRIEEEMRYLRSTSESEASYNKIIAIGGTYVDKKKFTDALVDRSMSAAGAIWGLIKKCVFKAGIGDLLIVRQTLKAYELAEFAHVENAIAGEFRERLHRRLDVTETITATTTETETQKERDLQSTERSEMQTEADKVVQTQAHVDAGLQVSGSYGPSISFTASLNAGFASSVQETQKKSTSYSREVTEKTAENVRSKVTEEQRRRVLAEIEETNTHRIDNTTSGKHMRGIYRWLNKIYDAQIYNYGQRMMYEFVIPEPAAFYLYATVENPPVDSDLIKPDAPQYYGAPLKPSNLSRTNYHNYVSQYNVTNAPEPPSAFMVKTYFDKQDGADNVNLGRAGAISIPDGYEGYAAYVNPDYVFPDDGEKHTFRVMLGGKNWDATPFWGSWYQGFGTKFRSEISISYHLLHVWAFNLGVDIFCSLTNEALEKWQLKMYDAIMQAYLDQKAAYDAKMEQKDIQKGVEILGRNPIENLRIEKEELKKLIIMILTKKPCLNINSFYSTSPCDPQAPDEPVMDLTKVCPNGSFIRFFENAFEWENILFVFYPYFWGRRAKWISALYLTDPDLDFAAFLKAGAARVQIPVRPGFEKAIAFYCQTGMIWDGNDVPLIGDDLYVPIIKEISENLGKLDDGVFYPDPDKPNPWEVTIPTSLVLLQDLDEIPNIRDMMTNKNIDITGA